MNLSFDYFKGFGLHLWFPTKEEGFIVLNVNNVCFDNSESDAILGFFPKATDNVNICYDCNHYGLLNFNETTRASQQTASDSRSEAASSYVPSASWSEWEIPVIVVTGTILIIVVLVVLSSQVPGRSFAR
jgi:hypothetical protein